MNNRGETHTQTSQEKWNQFFFFLAASNLVQPVNVKHLPAPVDRAASAINNQSHVAHDDGGGLGNAQKTSGKHQIDQVGKRAEDGVHHNQPAHVLLLVVVVDAVSVSAKRSQ